MPDDDGAPVPVAATLDAVVIRACRVHQECALECRERQVEDLGVVARIDKEKE